MSKLHNDITFQADYEIIYLIMSPRIQEVLLLPFTCLIANILVLIQHFFASIAKAFSAVCLIEVASNGKASEHGALSSWTLIPMDLPIA